MSSSPQLDFRRSRRPRLCFWIGPVTLACLLFAARPGGATEPDSGLVVESVAPASAASLSGFQPGDLVLTWAFRPRDLIEGRSQTGTLNTPFDLIDLFLETAPRGELTLEGRRQGRVLAWTLRSAGNLGLQA